MSLMRRTQNFTEQGEADYRQLQDQFGLVKKNFQVNIKSQQT